MSAFEGTHIHMVQVHDTGKTLIWTVLTKEDDLLLGWVKWFGRWRGYAFFPTPDTPTAYEQVCLREIADFVETKTREHRAKKKKERAAS